MGLTRVRVVINRGYLKIRTTANRKSRYKSLHIPMSSIHWNNEVDEVRKSHPDHEKLNAYIKEEVRKHYLFGDIPTRTIHGEPDIIAYFHRVVQNIANPGTQQVKIATLKKFTNFLLINHIKNLRLSDLTSEHVNKFYNHLLGEVSVNTAGHHVRQFKSVINKAIAEGKVNYSSNPFSTIHLRYVEPEIYGLATIEISQLMQEHHFRPNKHIAAFLFSLFSQGLRKRDMVLLRWGDFTYHYEKLYLSIIVKKTQKPLKIELSELAVIFLQLQLEEFNKEIRDILKAVNNKTLYHKREVEKREEFLSSYTAMGLEGKKNLLSQWIDEHESTNYKIQLYDVIDKINEDLIYHSTAVREYELDFYGVIGKEVHKLSMHQPKEFVFDYLRNERISKYVNVKEWKLVDGKSKNYNYHLKEAGKKVGFKNLTPHTARHSYARMLDENNTTIQTIQKLIGHSDPQRTVGYIRRLNKDAENDANTQLAEKFKKVRFQVIP